MDLISALVKFLKNEKTISEEAPAGYCPNCWGKQEYGGAFYETAKNYKADINSNNPQVGWVQDYANKHLSKIELKKEGAHLICNNCKLTYQIAK